MVSLLDPLKVGNISCANRIWMAPMTRSRATKQHVPTDLMIEYYKQRAGAGLIISEATGISREGLGWPNAPGIFNSDQVRAWKAVTDAVHSRGGKIMLQLWHMGRATHRNVSGVAPVSSSATKYPYPQPTYDGKKKPEVAHSLTTSEIKRVVRDFGEAASNAIAAGFDGVQVHGANGYLIDQFLRDSDNKRTDEYGGSIANRIRFLDEVVREVVTTVGADRTSVRLSPNGETMGTSDSDPEALCTEIAKEMNKYDLAFMELREMGPNDTFGKSQQPKVSPIFRELYRGTLVLNQEFNREKAEETLSKGEAAAIVFGRPFLSNPDLVEKIKHKDDDWARNDGKTWYTPGAKGYTDYPAKYSQE